MFDKKDNKMKNVFLLLIVLLTIFSANAQRIAVLEFKAGVGISQNDVDGISAIFITYFRPAGYTMVERSSIDQVIDEQGFQRSRLTESQMVRVGEILNVSKIVVGDINVVMGQYNVDVRVLNVESGTITATEGAAFSGDSYRSCMQDIAQKLASKIAISAGPSVSAAKPSRPVTDGPSQPVTDIDGNVYKTVKLGNQVWMAENLRTTRYADGTTIPLGTTESFDVAYRYYPNNNRANVSKYGYLYNWPAVMNGSLSSSDANPSGVQGICPDGWHVPSFEEWTELLDYVSSQRSQYVCGGDEDKIAKALASETGWNSSTSINCAVGNNPSTNNATGFSARPAGYYNGYYHGFGSYAGFWSASQNNSNDAYDSGLGYNGACVFRYTNFKYYGYSVRCVRN